MSETSVEPQSIAADKDTRPDRVDVWRVLRRDLTDDQMWHEMPSLEGDPSPWGYYPIAEDVGVKYGAGDYLFLRVNPKGGPPTAVETLRVVAETRYRQADDGEAVA